MRYSFTYDSQESLRTRISPMKGVRNENIVTITEDDTTISDGGEGEVTWLNSAVFKYAHDFSRFYELPPPVNS